MNDEARFEKWLDDPSVLSESDLVAVFSWREENPVRAGQIETRRAVEQQESEEREMLREDWIRRHGSEVGFATAYREHREKQATASLEDDAAAKQEWLRSAARTF